MSELIQYRGYYGSVHFDANDLIFHGKLEFIRALVSYEATNAVELKQAFEEAVDDYLETSQRNNIEPEMPFKGSFNIRVKPELHRKLAIAANHRDVKLNSFIAETLESAMAVFEQSDKGARHGHQEIKQTSMMARKAAKSSHEDHHVKRK